MRFFVYEREREKVREEVEVEERKTTIDQANESISPFPAFNTHPGHVCALDELGQQRTGAVPALVGVAALLRVVLLVVAALELALLMAGAASATIIMIAPSTAVTSAAAVHVSLAAT